MDLIERQAAIDAMKDTFKGTMVGTRVAVDAINRLPSAEPEIIYCKDCEYWQEGKCNYFSVSEKNVEVHMDSDGFCSEAERRKNE